jgi:hypothetical protein
MFTTRFDGGQQQRGYASHHHLVVDGLVVFVIINPGQVGAFTPVNEK